MKAPTQAEFTIIEIEQQLKDAYAAGIVDSRGGVSAQRYDAKTEPSLHKEWLRGYSFQSTLNEVAALTESSARIECLRRSENQRRVMSKQLEQLAASIYRARKTTLQEIDALAEMRINLEEEVTNVTLLASVGKASRGAGNSDSAASSKAKAPATSKADKLRKLLGSMSPDELVKLQALAKSSS